MIHLSNPDFSRPDKRHPILAADDYIDFPEKKCLSDAYGNFEIRFKLILNFENQYVQTNYFLNEFFKS